MYKKIIFYIFFGAIIAKPFFSLWPYHSELCSLGFKFISTQASSIIGFLGVMLGAFLSHSFTSYRDKKNYRIKLINEAYGSLSLISFTLAMQYSNLLNLSKNIKQRLEHLEIYSQENTSRDERQRIFQDFQINQTISINSECIARTLALIAEYQPGHKNTATKLQNCYLSNKKYWDIMRILENFNEMKRILKNNPLFIGNITNFSKANFPVYSQQIEKEKSFINQTFESLEELYVLLEKKPLKFDKEIEV